MTSVNRTKSIKILVTDDEKSELKNKADGKPTATFMREFCLYGQPKKRRKTPKVDPKFLRIYAGACNNLNQLTKYVNTTKDNEKTDSELLLKVSFELVKIRETLERLKKDASNI